MLACESYWLCLTCSCLRQQPFKDVVGHTGTADLEDEGLRKLPSADQNLADQWTCIAAGCH